MNRAHSALDYSALRERVLGYWPSSINVTQLRVDDEHPELFLVIGLGALGDSIIEKLESDVDAVLVTALCDALSSTIRSVAFFCTEIRPVVLRSSTVRANFEKRLNRIKENSDLGWSDDDLLLIQNYFLANK